MPAPVISPSTSTSTTFDITLTGLAADGTLEFQAAVRPDFKNCVCPIIGRPNSSPASFTGMNQDTAYYVRARSRRASGVAEDWSNTVGIRTALDTAPSLTTPAVLITPAMLVVPEPIIEWTGDNDIAGYPCSNLGFDAPVAWHSSPAGGTVASFLVRMAPKPVDTIALLMSNIPENSTVVVKAGTTTATTNFTSSTFAFRASANLANRPGYHALIQLPAAQTYQYWRVTITFASGITGYTHIEHAIFGLNRSSKNHSVDKTESVLDLGSYERGRSGIPQRTLGLRGKRVDFEISVMSQLQFETLYSDLPRLVGATMPVLVVPNTKTGAFLHDRILYGVLTGGKAANPASPIYSRSFTIDSILP